MLACLTTGIESPRDLHTAKGTVMQQPAVLAGERNPLGDAVVDDRPAHLREAVDVGLPRPEVAALDRVIEQPLDAVTVVAVVLRGVDAALRRDAVRTTGAVLIGEARDLVAGLAERGSSRSTGEAGADDDDRQLATVRRVDQLGVELARVPTLLDRACRCLLVRDGSPHRVFVRGGDGFFAIHFN